MRKTYSGLFCIALLILSSVGAIHAQQQPGESPDQQPGARLPMPPAVHVPETRMPGERGLWVGIIGWAPRGSNGQLVGSKAEHENPGNLNFGTMRKAKAGYEIGVALGLHNAIRVQFLETQARGSAISPNNNLTLWTQAYSKGDFLATNVKTQNVKVLVDYLTWPYPVKQSRLRLKTIWGVQYTNVQTRFNAPLLPVAEEDGELLYDDAGEPLDYNTEGAHWFFVPQIGVGLKGYIKPRFSVEVNAVGGGFPHRQYSWDGDASINLRLSHYEIRVGAKAMQFRTSPNSATWIRSKLFGPFVELQLHSDPDKAETR